MGHVTADPHLRITDADGIRVLAIDRPEAKNALTAAMRTAFIDVVASSLRR